MIQNGLIEEVLNFHEKYASDDNLTSLNQKHDEEVEDDESTGITIAIGYKEFLPYILEYERQKKELKLK